jgi:muramidase (phage lysozyme)
MWRRPLHAIRPRLGLIALLLALLIIVVTYNQSMTTRITPAAYSPLLATIAKGESKGNYNAHFGNAANTDIRFTEMSLAKVLQWQDAYAAQGNPSNAVGKYQIIKPTLAGLINELGLDMQLPFDQAIQDRMAIALLERRGAVEYVGKKLSREQFAANLAREWAALPKVLGSNPEESYYAHDGLNKSQISIPEIYDALAFLERRATR